jgi:hypothetical protein
MNNRLYGSLLWGFCIIITSSSWAQSTIQGKVIGAQNEPLPFAGVFVSNSTRGVAADANGRFVLDKVPSGVIELVGTYMGYENLVVRLKADTLRGLLVLRMKPQAKQLSEVTVKRLRNGFEQYYDQFLKHFLGQTPNARSCKLRNPKAIWFSLNDDNSVLTVRADEPLKIENKALGYEISYTLDSYEYHFNGQYVSYTGYALFKDMPTKSESKRQNWAKARQSAYLGSATHFFKSLTQHQTTDQGFLMQKMVRKKYAPVAMPATPEKRDSLGRIIMPASKRMVRVDTVDLALQKNPQVVVSQPNFSPYKQYLYLPPLADSTLVQPQGEDFKMAFNDYLYVTYQRENEDVPAEERRRRPQISLLRLTEEPFAIIEKNGHLPDPLSVIFEGRWGIEKMAEMLPLDYVFVP